MTWFVCRDATGHPAAAQTPLSDDVVATFGDNEGQVAMDLVEELKRSRRAVEPADATIH